MTATITLTRGVPASESFAIDAPISCAEQALRRYGTTILQYHPPRGFMPLREAIAEREAVPVEQIMLGNGSIQLLDLLIRTTLHPGPLCLWNGRPTIAPSRRFVGQAVRSMESKSSLMAQILKN